jgi:imidazolonepropionase-like amidohydrolase
MRIFIATFILFCGHQTMAQRTLLTNGYLHVGNGDVIQTALIGIEANEIILVKNSLAYPYDETEWDTIIDLSGQHIYPGFIAPNATLGLTEIDAIRATRDYYEVGQYNPHVRSQIAYNVESKVISTVKTNGLLLTQATPRGGVISGTSSVMATDGWNWEDATIQADDGIHVNWPDAIQSDYETDQVVKKKSAAEYTDQTLELYQFFELAKTYAYAGTDRIKDTRLEAMSACFKAEKRVYFHANELQQLIDVIEFAQHFELPFPVIVGGYDSYLVGQRLVDAEIPIMLLRPHSLPLSEDDPIDLPFQLPSLLQRQGIKYCIQNEGDMEAMNARNLPFMAGTAMAYGLTEEEAVASISLNTAQILGIDDNYGSIEVGKTATLFASKGNALDMKTNNVTLIMINGALSSTDNFQNELYQKYRLKYLKSKSKSK